MEAYPKDVNFVLKQFPLRQIHPHADAAARAAIAARKQGKFWEMHKELYANFRGISPDAIKGFAEKIGLDVAKFEADMNSEEAKKEVEDDLALGARVSVRGTPSFFINGKVARDRSVEGFKSQIDEELKKKKG